MPDLTRKQVAAALTNGELPSTGTGAGALVPSEAVEDYERRHRPSAPDEWGDR